MGKELAEAYPVARRIFDEIDDALGENLSRLMFEGPEDQLILTQNAQPALMATSLAMVRVLEGRGSLDMTDFAAFVAGHSLGEYSALTVAGSLEPGDTARLLRLRGQAMQRAVPVGVGAMAALLGLDLEPAKEAAVEASAVVEGEICTVANDNAPGQVVVSGHRAAVERAIEFAKARGAKKGVLLPVSAPFHCALMAPAAEEMAAALASVTIKPPAIEFVANVTAQSESDPENIRNLLVQQVTGMVGWRESVLHLVSRGVDNLLELGTGKVLTTMAKRIDKGLSAQALQSPDDVENFLSGLNI